MQTLKSKLVDFLLDNPTELKEIYAKFKHEKPTTIRGRLNENIDKYFKRLAKGVYISIIGSSKALLIEGDAWDILPKLSSDSMDVIITDSPYTILNKQLSTGTTRKKSGKWSFKTKDVDRTLYRHLYRVLKPGGHFFTFLPADSKDTLKFNNMQLDMASNAGFRFNKQFIWDKKVIGMGYHGRNKYEQILFLSKGKRRMPLDLSVPDLLSHKRISPLARVHETQKPIELIIDLIRFSSKPSEWILDPFSGSFTTSKAALKLGRSSVGIEIDKRHVNKARKMLNAVKLPIKRIRIRRKDNVLQHYYKRLPDSRSAKR